jgi:hypothetical protein
MACDQITLPPDLTITSGWVASGQQTAAPTTLTFITYARCSVTASESVVWVSDNDLSSNDFDDAACAVRFNPSNGFHARDGNSWSAEFSIDWIADTWYQIEMVINVTAETYTVQVGECETALSPLISDASFRTGWVAEGGGMDYHGLWATTGQTIDGDTLVWTTNGGPTRRVMVRA